MSCGSLLVASLGFPTGLGAANVFADKRRVQPANWDDLDLTALQRELRKALPAAEAEKMIWAFERALAVARVEGDLLRYLLAATASLVARAEETTPREVFEAFFRRSVSDEEWRDRYEALLA
jgi:hypothetical protein